AGWKDDKWVDFAVHSQCASLSQFLHGEQGALLCTARLVEAVPWIEAKYYGSTQVVDEARHVEAFARYLDEKMPTTYPINQNLKTLLDAVLKDERWDLVYLGMQVIIEGLALAAFGMMLGTTQEPLLKNLLRYVMADEARHVAFGILSLREVYDDLPADEFRLRQEFAYEACEQMRRRTLNAELWPSFGISNEEIQAALPDQEAQRRFQRILFSKIVPNCKKLGLLDHRDGWLRERFQEMNIIEFEDWENTAEALNLEGRVPDQDDRGSFDPENLEGVEVIEDLEH
ncbi:MAG: ferritin-like domain-containing protein, partial [Actinomycetota bacterium]|nr:ferritin-like domain-containing protein [Actinomycetota bacterium]MED5232885.1 ferritin-like domain-containing protein [Actinomycetota bacterium]